ncbi:hypothetical protein PCAR4_340102 [Paraburkholderia caribensis]|nr:hypothetical protein PCAR4_340102 [Paraburkholderia caribensis]
MHAARRSARLGVAAEVPRVRSAFAAYAVAVRVARRGGPRGRHGQRRQFLRAQLVELQQQIVDRAELRIGQVIGVEQFEEAFAPVGGREDGPTQVAMHRRPHDAGNVRDVLIDQSRFERSRRRSEVMVHAPHYGRDLGNFRVSLKIFVPRRVLRGSDAREVDAGCGRVAVCLQAVNGSVHVSASARLQVSTTIIRPAATARLYG